MDEILNALLPVDSRSDRRERSNDEAEGQSDVYGQTSPEASKLMLRISPRTHEVQVDPAVAGKGHPRGEGVRPGDTPKTRFGLSQTENFR